MRVRTNAAAVSIASLALAVSACGSEDEPSSAAPTDRTVAEPVATGPAAAEASPGEEPVGPTETGELSDEDEGAITAAVNAYVEGLNGHDGSTVCALFPVGAIRFEGGDLPPSELPAKPDACAVALASAIGRPPPRGGPAWKRTTINELKEVSVGSDRARVTATVTHQFADRKFPSVEDDVIYLDRSDDRWLIAKPSGTLYRAVGYPEPPLRSLAPPQP